MSRERAAAAPLSEEQFKALDSIVAWVLDPSRESKLNDFETDVANQMADRLGRYGRRALIGDKWREVARGWYVWRKTGEKPKRER